MDDIFNPDNYGFSNYLLENNNDWLGYYNDLCYDIDDILNVGLNITTSCDDSGGCEGIDIVISYSSVENQNGSAVCIRGNYAAAFEAYLEEYKGNITLDTGCDIDL